MAQFVKPEFVRDAVTVGLLTTTIVPATSLKGHDSAAVIITNPSGDSLSADIEFSADGTNDWKVLPDDAFQPVSAGDTRWAFIDARYQFFRVRGTMAVGAQSIYRSVFLHRGASRPG